MSSKKVKKEETMKKGKRVFLAAIICFLCIAVLAGCSSGIEGKLLGTWQDGNSTVTFYNDGTFTSYGTGTWHIVDESTLKMTYANSSVRTLIIESITSDTVTFEGGYMWEKIK